MPATGLSGYTPNVIPGAALAQVHLPAGLKGDGMRAYRRACARCHGDIAQGKDGIAPPLVHVIYGQAALSDAAVEKAMRQGVGAHHWPFGNMPAIEGLSDQQIVDIIQFLRALQQANGID